MILSDEVQRTCKLLDFSSADTNTEAESQFGYENTTIHLGYNL